MDKNKRTFNLIVRLAISSVMFTAGLIFSNSIFFNEYPLFGVPFVAETIISVAAGLVGFYLVPRYFFIIKDWFEALISATIQRLVGDFWNQYMKRMDETRAQRKTEEKSKKKEKEEKLREKLRNGVLIDTSVLIDGRILGIAEAGFIQSTLVIPEFVIDELHLLADNKNDLKRNKGRRGLDLISDLKKAANVHILRNVESEQGVDKELVNLAKKYKLSIMTLDFNLNKVANVSSIKVLNVNLLVEAVKPVFVPGENLQIKIVHEGKETGQGVGYLEDGTMVVVSEASALLDKEVSVTVSKLIQTPAGKMVFCEISK